MGVDLINRDIDLRFLSPQVQHPSGLVQGVMVAALGLAQRVKVYPTHTC